MLKQLLPVLLVFACDAWAQGVDSEPAAIVELGGAGSWNFHNGASSVGADAAIEFTPIENWLEMEAGTTPLFTRHSTEWDTDLLFKKPWTLSKKAEFMVGIGPEWVHTSQSGIKTSAIGAEFALDFMYWPGGKHKFGWFVEPSYDYTFGHGRERSIGVSWGFLIAIP